MENICPAKLPEADNPVIVATPGFGLKLTDGGFLGRSDPSQEPRIIQRCQNSPHQSQVTRTDNFVPCLRDPRHCICSKQQNRLSVNWMGLWYLRPFVSMYHKSIYFRPMGSTEKQKGRFSCSIIFWTDRQTHG